MYYICLENAVKSCPTLCFPDEMELLRGWTKKFLWVANLRMHAPEDRGYVPMFLTVPFLMMGVVEAKEVLEVVVMLMESMQMKQVEHIISERGSVWHYRSPRLYFMWFYSSQLVLN